MYTDQAFNKKQFDHSHIVVDEKLQGAKLASFPRRALAYGIDWFIVILCTRYFVLILPLLMLALLAKKKFRSTLIKSRRILKKNLKMADQKLETIAIEEKVRTQFRRHMTIYLYVIIYAPVVIASFMLITFIVNFISDGTYEGAKASIVDSLVWFTQPITDMNDAVALMVRFFGGFMYFTFFTWKWQGYTPGKKFLQIRVVKLNGSELSLWGSLERVMGYTASTSLLGLGFFQYFWDRNRQTTHDKITETIVIDN